MAGYIRQSTADIIPTATVRAAPINAEYNALRDAFSATGGHKHDGTTGEGEYIPLIADLDALNKVVIDTTNNRIGFFVEVSSAAVEQVRIQDGVILPVTNNDIDLGSNGAKFKNLYIQGTADIGTVDINAGNIDGTIIGSSTPAAATFTSATLNNNLSVTGTSTLVGTTTVTSIDLNSGAIDNTTIGTTTPVAGTFTTLAANTSLTAATADINGGTLDNAAIGSSTPSTAAFTTLSASGTATLATVDINAGNIDNTTIGASNPVAGSFTTVSTSGNATLATANISGGSINGTTVGASSPTTGAFTTLSASGGVTGDLTGNVTGNITGDVTGDLTGNVAGNLTGNVTSTGTSTFNNVTIDGTLNMNAGTTATITNLTNPTNNQDAATKAYVDTSVANLIDSAPDSLNTLNELAAALNDDDDAFNTLNTAIGTKLPKAGGTMTGAIAMGTNAITGLGDPSAAQDAATKNYVDTQDALQVTKSGDTMSGNLAMGNNKITGLGTPTATTDATNKTYVDGILGSATAAASSASAAATSASNAATSETNAASSASAAAADRATVASLYDSFDDRYLGPKSSAPTQDNDGNALVVGALYFNSTNNIMYVYGSGGWQAAGSSVNGTSDRQTYTATAGQTVFAATYDAGYVDVYLNGVKLLAGTDFTATNGTSVTLASGAAVNDIVDIVAYGTFVLSDHYTKTQADARYVQVAGDTMTGDLNITGTLTSDGVNVGDTSSSFSAIYITSSTSGESELRLGDTDTDAGSVSYTNSNDTMTFRAAAGARMALNSTGLNITGTLTSDGLTVDLPNTTDVSIDGTDGGGIQFKNSGAEQFRLDSASNDGALYHTPSGKNHTFKTDGASRLKIATGGDISFFEDTGTTPKFFWDSSAERLGIGTSSPDLKLDVSHGTTSQYVATFQNTADSLELKIGTTTGGALNIQGANANNNNAYDIGIQADGGNVGIGTSDPSTPRRMEIVGSASDSYSSTNSIVSNVVARFRNGSDSNTAQRYGGISLESGNAQFAVQTVQTGTYGGALTIKTRTGASSYAERMRIDSSGNLLVGTTDKNIRDSSSAEGMVYRNGDSLDINRSAAPPLIVNRVGNSDGDLTLFRKDGATVGSIGSVSGSVSYIVLDPRTNGSGIRGTTNGLLPTNQAGTATNDHVDLGSDTNAFRNLYLSGGAYIGGTGSANKLDDYEEGTWTPAYRGSTTAGTATGGSTEGFYTKIGNSVTIWLRISNMTISGAVGATTITGLPFTSSHGSAAYASVAMAMTHNIDFATDRNQSLYVVGTNLNGLESRNGTNWADWPVTNSTGIYINFTMTYRTS